jgi:phage replication-related protein YjqB (UPF0714/DUF867 family)
MPDKYHDFEQLKKKERPDHFTIFEHRGTTGVAIIAPHGGGIETGTSEIARGIAGTEHSLYCFEGKRPSKNRDLHITSTNFDEPIGVEIVNHAEKVVAIHGCADKKEIIYLSGLDDELKNKIRKSLIAAGFRVEEPATSSMQGTHLSNICNRGKNKCGVQVEISEGLRRTMFEDHTKRAGREITKPAFNKFVTAMREAIS